MPNFKRSKSTRFVFVDGNTTCIAAAAAATAKAALYFLSFEFIVVGECVELSLVPLMYTLKYNILPLPCIICNIVQLNVVISLTKDFSLVQMIKRKPYLILDIFSANSTKITKCVCVVYMCMYFKNNS